MATRGIPLLTHGEVTHAEVDIFDRGPLYRRRPRPPAPRFTLRVVMEHVTTAQAVAYVTGDQSGRLAQPSPSSTSCSTATTCWSGLRPHYYCLPVLKRRAIRLRCCGRRPAVIRASFWAPTAPRTRPTSRKMPAAARACFRANALACLAQTFEDAGALERLEGFVGRFGADFYGLPVSERA